MECYLAIKRNKPLIDASSVQRLQKLMPSEESQSQKVTPCMISFKLQSLKIIEIENMWLSSGCQELRRWEQERSVWGYKRASCGSCGWKWSVSSRPCQCQSTSSLWYGAIVLPDVTMEETGGKVMDFTLFVHLHLSVFLRMRKKSVGQSNLKS